MARVGARAPGPASLVQVLALVLLALERSAPALAQGLPASPCPGIYTYEVDSSGQTVGLIRLLTPARYAEVRLVARLSSPVPVQRHEVGELLVKGGREAAMEATRHVLAGRRHTLEYHLRFPPGKPVPSLLALTVNEAEVCSAPRGESETPAHSRSTITLQSFLNTGVSDAPQVSGHEFGAGASGGGGFGGGGGGFGGGGGGGGGGLFGGSGGGAGSAGGGGGGGGIFVGSFHQEPVRTTPRPVPTRAPPTPPDPEPFQPEPWFEIETTRRPRPPTPRPPPPPIPIDETKDSHGDTPLDPANCGTATLHNALVVFGAEAKKGQWPWQTAIFRNNESESNSVTLHFQCGGTLVSKKHVVTAAHCVVMVRERKKIQLIASSDLLISLGKYNIRNWAEPDQQLKEVHKITVHPQYNPEILRNDLSIIQLSSTVTITDFVKPICLWDRLSDLNSIVGEIGTVGGWGRDETGSLSDKLRIATMPIVSQETCLRSDNTFYVKYTSENTFCAGFRNGTTVCNGDSGGGLHLRMENPRQGGQKTWFLRGVVSLSMLEVGEQTCDTHNFVVFTDVAKYMTWLVQQI